MFGTYKFYYLIMPMKANSLNCGLLKLSVFIILRTNFQMEKLNKVHRLTEMPTALHSYRLGKNQTQNHIQ